MGNILHSPLEGGCTSAQGKSSHDLWKKAQKADLGVLFAEIAVYDVLDREVVAAEGHVVAPRHGGVLLPHVHLQVAEEVPVLLGHKGQQRPQAPHQGGVHLQVFWPLNSRCHQLSFEVIP